MGPECHQTRTSRGLLGIFFFVWGCLECLVARAAGQSEPSPGQTFFRASPCAQAALVEHIPTALPALGTFLVGRLSPPLRVTFVTTGVWSGLIAGGFGASRLLPDTQ